MNGYAPEIGDLVCDEATRKVGEAKGHEGPYWQVRPDRRGAGMGRTGPSSRYGSGEAVGRRGPDQRPQPG
ncbi:hypothetical protein [Streptomyces fulvoviolaceus]|uniref:hypothetical protein n=1 Tax=Streptomyces fulvoviolaceus TaxID=285535 RepID=UPI000ACB546C